jgi:2-aminoadipate transaminase
MPDGVSWTEPPGGFLAWLRLPDGLDAMTLRVAALEAGVAYVPGAQLYASDAGAGELRLSFSALDEADLAEAGRRPASAIRSAL